MMETIVINTSETYKKEQIIEFLKSLNVTFELKKEKKKKEKPYDPDFVKMVLEAKKGKSTRINPKNLWESIL